MLIGVRHAVRMLLKHKGFTTVAVLSLALGIGANAAIFGLLDALLLRSLPVRQPERLVLFGSGQSVGITISFPDKSWQLFSYPFYKEVRQHTQTLSELTAIHSFASRVHGVIGANGSATEPEQFDAQLVSGTFFSTLGVNAVEGRTFTAADDEIPGGHPVVVASHSWWERRFGRDPSIVGKTITIAQTSYTIIGVTPAEFFGTTVGESPDIWVPLAMEEQLPPGFKGLDNKSFQSLNLIGRLKDGVSEEQASAEVNLLFQNALHDMAGPQPSPERLRDMEQARIDLTPAGRGLSELRSQFSLPLRILMAVVGLVLLIACANLANLLLARATSRQQEFAIRIALGAGRGRIIRQLLGESLLLALLGGAAGLIVASWGGHLLLMMVSTGSQPLPLDVGTTARVLAFTLFLSLLSALVFGTIPALRATRAELTPMLKERSNAPSGMTRSPLGKSLVAGQVALSLLLLVGAGLFVRTLINLQSVDPGFNTKNVLLLKIDTDSIGYKADSRLVALYHAVEERVKRIPGVRAASFSMFSFNQGGWIMPATTTGDISESRGVHNNAVGPDFFEAMGLPLVAGRNFGPGDTENSTKVAVISEIMMKRFFPGSPAIGKRFKLGGGSDAEDLEVIGVVKDAKYGDLAEQPEPMVYHIYSQSTHYLGNLEVSFAGDMAAIVSEVRRAILGVNNQLPIVEVSTMSDQVERSLVQQKLIARLSSFFGLLALLLACIGLFGVMSYAVARRTNEIGIRMALGARPGNVLWLVTREALAPVAIGLAIGLPAALSLARLISSQIFGLTPTDPSTVLAATVMLIAAATLAGYLPARRALRIDPMTALRDE